MLLLSSIFHFTVPRYIASALPTIPFTFHVIGVGFFVKSCRSFVMEADAPSSNMRGCELESKEFFLKLSLKCIGILCMLQCPFDNLLLLSNFGLLLRIFSLWCCLRCLFIPEVMCASKRVQTMFMMR